MKVLIGSSFRLSDSGNRVRIWKCNAISKPWQLSPFPFVLLHFSLTVPLSKCAFQDYALNIKSHVIVKYFWGYQADVLQICDSFSLKYFWLLVSLAYTFSGGM